MKDIASTTQQQQTVQLGHARLNRTAYPVGEDVGGPEIMQVAVTPYA
jgi:hypothetical protein